MSWIHEYQEEITAWEQAKDDAFPIDSDDPGRLNTFMEDFDRMIEPFRHDGSESELADVMTIYFSQSFGESELRAAKQEAAILCRLAPFFERLLTASESEWEEYQEIRLKARMRSKVFQQLLRMMHSGLQKEPPPAGEEGVS